MSLAHTIKYICNHPLSGRNKLATCKRFAKWQIRWLIDQNPGIYPFVENSKLYVQKGMTGATGNIYCGLHEFDDMGFLLHFLRSEDLFFDIGANIGSYTVLASAVVGSHSISVEPVPQTFSHLRKNILINDIIDKTKLYNIGLAEKSGQLRFSNSLDTVNHVITNENESDSGSVVVNVETLDNIAVDNIPLLIKMDVEGFESNVIDGGKKILAEPSCKALIIELNGLGIKYGFSTEAVHDKLIQLGFNPYKYEPFTRSLTSLLKPGSGNTIYIKDIDFAKERISSARKFHVIGSNF